MNITHPAYLVFVGIGVLVMLLLPASKHLRNPGLRKQYYLLQGITLMGAVLGAKLSVLFGDLKWPWVPIDDWQAVLWSGRSIVGALIFGFLFAEVAKPLLGYAMPPNDRFAAILPFTVATGRVGCWISGCCQGLPSDRWYALRGVDGVPRYPAQLVEILFHLSVGVAFIIAVKRGWLFGRLFSVYLISYAVFRFFTECLRETPKFLDGLSGYQWLCLPMLILGAAFFLKRTIAPPGAWGQFRPELNKA